MTKPEMVMLTRYVQALCPSQHFDEFTPDAWMDVFGHLRVEDCRMAAARIARKSRYVSACDVVAEVAMLRAQRIDAAPPLELPADFDPDSTADYARALQRHHEAAGDGAFEHAPQTQVGSS